MAETPSRSGRSTQRRPHTFDTDSIPVKIGGRLIQCSYHPNLPMFLIQGHGAKLSIQTLWIHAANPGLPEHLPALFDSLKSSSQETAAFYPSSTGDWLNLSSRDAMTSVRVPFLVSWSHSLSIFANKNYSSFSRFEHSDYYCQFYLKAVPKLLEATCA